MTRLILLRHGQSEWNKRNVFTGWVDIPLSAEGIKESLKAGEEIQNIPIDVIFTSTLIRGLMTAMLAMSYHQSQKVPEIIHEEEGEFQDWYDCHDQKTKENLVPVIKAWQLNERMYGALQGKNKQQMREEYGDEQVHIWRRSYGVAPPQGESLKMTAERTLPYFEQKIFPRLQRGENILIAAHGNSLRSIIMKLEKLSEEEILNLEIPTAKPIIYEYPF